jgi:hypothetical protein
VDEVTRRIAERLAAPARESRPPADLADRILVAVRQRRRQRRRNTVLAGVMAVAIVAAIVALRNPGPTATPPGPPPTHSSPTLSAPASALLAPPAPEALDELVDRTSAVTQPVRISSTPYHFRVDSLGPTGVLLGGTGFDGDPFRDTDANVWLAAPGDAPPAPVTARGDPWAHSAGDRTVAWLEHRDEEHDFQLICIDLDRGRTAVQISNRGVPKTFANPVHVDGDTIVWMDERRTTWAMDGCAGTPRQLPASGPVVAFAYPDAFVADLATREIRMVDVETYEMAPVPVLSGVDWSTGIAASPAAIAWVRGPTLMVFDRSTGRTREVAAPLPASNGTNGDLIDLTAGGRLVVYATRPMDGSPMSSASLVYDVRTGRSVTLASEAYAAGDLLLWREAARYVVAHMRP